MRLLLLAPLFTLFASAHYNCVCEDTWGAYPSVTLNCCRVDKQWGKGTVYMADVPPYACVNPDGALDGVELGNCCRRSGTKPYGYGGARCWV
ncbi:hypothetical protein Q9L58_006988 [Maublancomyces gigas]|uniref:Uncharacterized protein n=1 Tax=Discina gigas TaxID=1032678 RepID=A0ABR3GDX6_9PEZI